MITRELIKSTVAKILLYLHNDNFEKCNVASQYPFHGRRNWEQHRQSVFESLNGVAAWNDSITQPRYLPEWHQHTKNVMSMISLLAETGHWYGNCLVCVWYLYHVLSAATDEQREKELATFMQDFTEEDLSMTELRGSSRKQLDSNKCARLMFVAPLLLRQQVEDVVASHGLDIHSQ